ncbi:MAG: TetR/AcrR family transcriptional regulator [Acidobacteriaceae bacterium]
MGRPRSALAHEKVLKAAAELFAERGIDATSMDAIAETSGVSKATIYKHWADKEALCLEVLGYVHGLDEEPPKFDAGNLRADLIARLTYEPAANRQDLKEKLWPHLMAYSAKNDSFGQAWRARVTEPLRRGLAELLARGQRKGALRRGIDLDVALALLLGPLMYTHVFMKKQGKPSPKNLVAQVVDGFLARFGKGS